MIATVDFSQLIPHQDGMCLLERVVRWDEQLIVLTTHTHRSPDNPLRRNGRLRALHLCEYGAQAMAVHGALKAQAHGTHAAPGVLVALRSVALLRDYIDDLPEHLEVSAQCLQASPTSLQYEFRVQHRGQEVAAGRAAVVLGQL
jgi:predicted hotdog family 3-hydroxylacyl-ACP dehydratase